MANARFPITLLAATLVATSAPLLASLPTRVSDETRAALLEHRDTSAGIQALRSLRPALRLNEDHDFRHLGLQADLEGTVYQRIGQTYRGVRVYGGETVLRHAQGQEREVTTDRLFRDIAIDTTPSMSLSEIRSIARDRFRPFGVDHVPGKIELIVFPIRRQVPRLDAPERPLGPNAADFEMRIEGYRLAYFVRNTELNHPEGPRQMVHILDAHTGQVLDEWDDLHTDQAVRGTGRSQYSGTVTLDTNRNASGVYELRDLTRGSLVHPWTHLMGNQTNNLNNKGKTDPNTGNYLEDPGLGTLYTDTDNAWGDGTNYVEGSSSTSAQGQTGAVDTHFGVAMTWDYYRNVHGRNGIDGQGTSALNRVHYAHGDTVSEANAFWIGYDSSDPQACFCMTYGDGANDPTYGVNMTEMTALDVAGHELSHGVCETTAGLDYSHDAGGLNEANSDINGTMVEFYVRGAGGTGSTVPDTGGNWLLGNELSPTNTPLRWMYKPSKDGKSFDAWKPEFNTSTDSRTYNPHYTSGPLNRCFYFLSQGASSSSTSDYYSAYLSGGMSGLGNHKSAQIWYHALLKLTTYATYLDARNAAIAATKEIYGAGGAEEAAVWNAFAAINVGAKWPNVANTVTASITTPSGNITIPSGTNQSFVGAATDSATGVTWTYAWTFGDGGTASTASTSHTYTNTGASSVNYTATFKATDNTGAFNTATRTITVTPVVVNLPPSITSQPANQTVTAGSTATFSVTASGTAPFTYQWKKNGTAISGATAASYTTPATATSDSGSTFSVTVTNAYGSATSSNATLTVNPVIIGTFMEAESNNTIATANVVAPSYTAIQGNLSVAGDVDNFALTLQPGQKITIDMSGPAGPDWDLFLKDSAGTTLVKSDGSTTTESLTYTNSGSTAMTVYAQVTIFKDVSATPYKLALTYSNVVVPVTYNEVEANNSIATANAVPDTATKIVGYITSTTDNDYFAVKVGAGKTLKVDMTGPTGTSYDYDLFFYDASGLQLVKSDGSTTTESCSWTNTGASATTVYVAVKYYKGTSSTTPYNLAVTR